MTLIPLRLFPVLLVLPLVIAAGCTGSKTDTDAFSPVSVSPPATTLRMYQGFFNDGDAAGIASLLSEEIRLRCGAAAVEERIRPFVTNNVTMDEIRVATALIYPDGTADLTFSVRWRLHDGTVQWDEYVLKVVAEDGLWRLPCLIEP
ncbi:hypothetical protein FGU65_06725 [Methanoculleus sp. FWC-SCC1]|uniref:NTF2-like N-terminal transpeptidase domain-containing protein n=1 Tax=Methanoculleus frigidifontis TaxID=2584085 RepID=A0ABT8M9G1_9EURY|nr:NTF2-like N-terminal transpeptidase domain-containing protein [Methanoculleus sp. FWC-SCC1]MDN7024582.1 hypothetical protein [Methanoculleus sp. FWC-SCC1]